MYDDQPYYTIKKGWFVNPPGHKKWWTFRTKRTCFFSISSIARFGKQFRLFLQQPLNLLHELHAPWHLQVLEVRPSAFCRTLWLHFARSDTFGITEYQCHAAPLPAENASCGHFRVRDERGMEETFEHLALHSWRLESKTGAPASSPHFSQHGAGPGCKLVFFFFAPKWLEPLNTVYMQQFLHCIRISF